MAMRATWVYLVMPLAVVSGLAAASCSSETTDGSSSASTSDAGPASSTAAGAGGVGGAGVGGEAMGGGAACLPDGIYGKCSENAGCFCLLGATVYQFCTINCQDVSECGNAADFPGAVPGCYPINPGAQELICALVCTTTADCPCGLTCMPSGVPNTNICAELQ